MQSAPNKSMEWLVNTPQNKKYCLALAAACQGNDGLANVIAYFLYEAAREVQGNMPQEEVEYVELHRSHKDILLSLSKFNKSISEKTLIKRIVKLQSLQFLESDGHHQIYRIFFRRVEEAMKNPPQPEKAKPRGIHARKAAQQEASEHAEDCKFTVSPEITVSREEDARRMVVLEQQTVNLQFQIVNLQDTIVKLQSQIVDLQSSQSCEKACRADLEAKIEVLYNSNKENNTLYNINTITPESAIIETTASAEASETHFEKEEITSSLSFSSSPPPQQEEIVETDSKPIKAETASSSQYSSQPLQDDQEEDKPIEREIPLSELPWSDEKLVRIVETKRLYRGKVGAPFLTTIDGDGKKSQRQRQLDAAKKIRARGITEEQFIRAYTDRNDLWWNNTQGSLTAEDMAANTPKKNMRIVEILEKLESRYVRPSNAKPERPDRSSYASNIIMAPNPSPTNMRDLMTKVAAQRAATATTGGIS